MEAALMVPPTRQGSTWRKRVPCPLGTKPTSALSGQRAAATSASSPGLPTRAAPSAEPPPPRCA
eukprot:7413236-Alexandrium_andersonii.AAC.1